MGIPFKLYEGKEANLPAELTAGGIYFCEDSGNVFIDVDIDGTVTRVPLGKKYVDDQLVDIREFIENQGSGIEIGDEAPTKESANVWINTSDEDEEGVEYLGVVTSINGQGGDVNITASDIDAAEEIHASQHASGGSDPITPAAIGALAAQGFITNGSSLDDLADGVYRYNGWAGSTITGSVELPFTNADGIWVKKTSYNGVGVTSTRVDAVANCKTGDIYTMYSYNGTWHKNVADALPRDGSAAMTGNVTVETTFVPSVQLSCHGTSTRLEKQASETTDYGTSLKDFDRDGKVSEMVLYGSRSLNDLIGVVKDSTFHTILHTGNKPHYEYGGNGQVRTEPVGGLGRALIISSGAGIGLVTAYGAIFSNFDGETKAFHNSVIRYGYTKDSGELEILSDETNTLFNADGVSYFCQVL